MNDSAGPAQASLDAAEEFLRPALNRDAIRESKAGSIVDVLARNQGLEDENEDEKRTRVVGKAVSLLNDIHQTYTDPLREQGPAERGKDPSALDAKQRQTVHALLDLISIEGIYPSLSEGVGIPLEKRLISVLPQGVVARHEQPANEDATARSRREHLLLDILSHIATILRDRRDGIQQLVLSRILPDIISSAAELAFNSRSISTHEKQLSESLFYYAISGSATPTLLSILSAFLQSNPVLWFKHQITSQLSHLPLRPDGVLQTVVFLASQMAPTLGQQQQGPGSDGPPITVQTIMQTSRVLSSIPANLTPEAYFANIGPKLLSLLDGKDADLKKTAAYVIGNGILGKKAYGAPKAVGYEIFVRPILDALNGVASQAVQTYLRRFNIDGTSHEETAASERGQLEGLHALTVIREQQLSLALSRLYSLVMLHPNPILLRRLVLPAMLPLWGLVCYAKEHNASSWGQTAYSLLQTYFSITSPFTRYEVLIQNILWDGGNSGRWVFARGDEGGVSIRKTPKGIPKGPADFMELVNRSDERIDDFLTLLASDPQSDEAIAHVFLYASSRWLLDESKQATGSRAATFDPSSPSNDLQQMLKQLVSAKLTEKLLDKFKETLSRHPVKVLDIVHQLIDSEGRRLESQGLPSQGPSIIRLSSIVDQSNGLSLHEAEPDTVESLSAACSLLSTILSSPQFTMTDKVRPILTEIRTKLDAILPKLPDTLTQAANTASVLLEIALTGRGADPGEFEEDAASKSISERGDALLEQHNLHRQALQNLQSDALPVQAEGLTSLGRLINMASPILDIPSTSQLLLSFLTDPRHAHSDDEFIYLNVIKCISQLASRHPQTVVKQLSEAYADQNEEVGLDQRLRIGEALLSTVQGLDRALIGQTAQTLGETMLTVAGRRTRRPKTHSHRKAAQAREAKAKRASTASKDRDLEEAMRSEMKRLEKEHGLEDPDAESPATAAHSAKFLAAWERGASNDEQPEDLRVRTSALSILASAIKSSIAGLGPSIVASAIDLSLSALNLESGPESAILRRASVVLLNDVLTAVEAARDDRIDLGFGFSFTTASTSAYDLERHRDRYAGNVIGNVPTILRTLAFVESREEDQVVKGHIQAATESYKAWFEKSLLWGIGAGADASQEPQLTLGDRLAGLSVNPGNMGGSRGERETRLTGPRIEEIE
ncbi:hypothetical protein KEM52_001969 [Ascosphaera acerosa]|nr:hypothetical protein KEM52_001969 [Ascosphaera acerosa]